MMNSAIDRRQVASGPAMRRGTMVRLGFIAMLTLLCLGPWPGAVTQARGFSQGLAGVVRKVFMGGDYLRPPRENPGPKNDPGANFSGIVAHGPSAHP